MSDAEEYPEHVKLKAVRDESQAIGEFIEWLSQNGYYICERRESGSMSGLDSIVPARASRNWEWFGDTFCELLEAVRDEACLYWPTTKRLPNKLLSEYFGIDEEKLEEEKGKMLEKLRALQSEKKEAK